ncbi:MAG TPA: carbohydrate kinase [Jiangellaceae bacterium]
MIVVAGEALIDLVAEPDGRYRALPGGSPANVAVGLARLGRPTEMLARISDSAFGRLIRDHLTGNGVGLRHAVTAAQPATLAVVTRPPGAEPHYDFYLDGTADWAWTDGEIPSRLPEGTRALCTGSLALARSPGAEVLAGLLERVHGRVTTVVDPNIRPGVMDVGPAGRARVEANVALADVVKVSAADLETIAPGEEPADVAKRWLSLGPRLVVVTRGAAGAYAVTSGGAQVEAPGRPVDVVDTIGAGDAFTSGLVDALDRHGLLVDGARRIEAADRVTLRRIVDHAALVAALTCTRPGADPPDADAVVAAGAAEIR